jgi:hypothetical protein
MIITTPTTTQAWEQRLHVDFTRVQQIATQLAAAASEHDLTPGELHGSSSP